MTSPINVTNQKLQQHALSTLSNPIANTTLGSIFINSHSHLFFSIIEFFFFFIQTKVIGSLYR